MSLKRSLLSTLRRAGIVVYRQNRGQIFPPEIPDQECYEGPEDYSRLYRPWRSATFRSKLRPTVLEHTMLSPQKLHTLSQLLTSSLPLEGDVFEAGTCSGGSARLMLDIAIEAGASKTFWFLDTFEGYQKIDADRDGRHVKIAECRGNSLEEVHALLTPSPMPVHLVPGLIPESLASVTTEKLCFAHIDVNLHEPTGAATEFCLERMVPGGVILFDDYNWPATYGARRAIDEAAARWGHPIISLPESTQAFLIYRP